MNNSYYGEDELKKLGLKGFGKNVFISRKASFYNPKSISIGNNVRIDDFCILSGNINIGSFVHIAAYCVLYGRMGILVKDFCSLSAKVIIYSASDDFSGKFLAGPTMPEKYTNVSGGKVTINKYVLVGAGSIVFPNIVIGEGVAVGSMSLVNTSLDAWGIYVGIPAKFLKKRSRELLKKQKALLKEMEKW
jgi:galactoside O-acetyltransferase